MGVNIEPSWKAALAGHFETSGFAALTDFVRAEYKRAQAANTCIYPAAKDIFRSFWLTPLPAVRVVILGQDPYHGSGTLGNGQAHGLSFSVPVGEKVPPSLVNIYKEIERDLKVSKDFKNGNLTAWAEQGVLLLNAILTVVAAQPASHKGKGWEALTDHVIQTISKERTGVVFMLWGNYARSKRTLIDATKHLVLEAPHPSPLSVYQGFAGCGHFSKCNEFLLDQYGEGIAW